MTCEAVLCAGTLWTLAVRNVEMRYNYDTYN